MNPAAACCASHSRTYRSWVPVFVASSAGVTGPVPARARYSPSSSPTTTIAVVAAPVRAPATCCANAPTLSMSRSIAVSSLRQCSSARAVLVFVHEPRRAGFHENVTVLAPRRSATIGQVDEVVLAFAVLGALGVCRDGVPVPLPAGRRRAVLAAL